MLTTILSNEQRSSFLANGYLVAPRVVPDPFLRDLQDHLEQLVEARIAEWQRASLLDEGWPHRDFRSRYHRAWVAAGRPQPPAPAYEGLFAGGRFAELAGQGWIRDLIAALLGVAGMLPLESSFGRAKFPFDERSSLPWHQDAQCLQPISGLDFVTAWIPLFDVVEENPCLEVSPIGEDQPMLEPTWSSSMAYTFMGDADVARLEEVRRVTLRRGDLLVLSPFIPHRSVTNTGHHIRWSADFRYAPMRDVVLT